MNQDAATAAATLYQRWLTELWNGDLNDLAAAAASLVSEDFVGNWPGQPALVRGPDALADIVRQGRLPFTGLTFTPQLGPIAAGDLVAARWTGRGTYVAGKHALPGATAPAGTPVEFSGHDLLRISGNRFTEYWVISEGEHLMAQLTRG
ncbi:ester cyclase [Actinomadura alba]|uniref:Ester cyclase n=1 Tax=Actinomadura alba TaxID=406431 RepID=A0ABR7LI57_9ACTN|nr:nuclear transport factor 2 family protein [Actinomadura alba]MBC6464185.1 ester cyclase [Actinomadura alba]